MRSRLSLLWLSAFILILPGCFQPQRLMATPAPIAMDIFNPFEDVPASERSTDTPVFVASVRGLDEKRTDDPRHFYNDDRSSVIRLGKASVRIGEDETWDELIQRSTEARRPSSPIIRMREYEDYGVLWSSVPAPFTITQEQVDELHDKGPAHRFVDALESEFDATNSHRIIIFVHGFNTIYHKNMGLAAEFFHYMGRRGAVINFAWPSEHSVFQYEADKANAAYATRQFRQLLLFLASETSADTIDIIAHSAGNPVVVEAMRDIALMHPGEAPEQIQRTTKIDKVVLAAPDMDLLLVVNAALDGFAYCANYITLYASTHDRALGLSSLIFKDTRFGASVGHLSPGEKKVFRTAKRFQAVDATYAQSKHSSFLGHSYFHQNPWVSGDIGMFLLQGMKADQRGLVFDEDTSFWIFPKDYTDNLEKIKAGETPSGVGTAP